MNAVPAGSCFVLHGTALTEVMVYPVVCFYPDDILIGTPFTMELRETAVPGKQCSSGEK